MQHKCIRYSAEKKGGFADQRSINRICVRKIIEKKHSDTLRYTTVSGRKQLIHNKVESRNASRTVFVSKQIIRFTGKKPFHYEEGALSGPVKQGCTINHAVLADQITDCE